VKIGLLTEFQVSSMEGKLPDIDIQISEVSWILWRTTINQGYNILFVLHLRGFIGQGNRGDLHNNHRKRQVSMLWCATQGLIL